MKTKNSVSKKIILKKPDMGIFALFTKEKNTLFLSRLFNLLCSFETKDEGPTDARGLLYLKTNQGTFESHELLLHSLKTQKNSLKVQWKINKVAVIIESIWETCPKTGILSRQDKLINNTKNELFLNQYSYRFVFTPSHYEIYSQSSLWCNENQGNFTKVTHGSFSFGNKGARTTKGGTPFFALKETLQGNGVTFHIVPMGNWSIDVHTKPIGNNDKPLLVVELGMAHNDLAFKIPPHSHIDFPKLLLQDFSNGKFENGTSKLHEYLYKNVLTIKDEKAPVVYNTWFDAFECLEPVRLRAQLNEAKKLGVEIFTVDAGWYGQCTGDWFSQSGDWREKLDGAFKGEMLSFSNEVREAGLGFGLWIEPERYGKNVPILQKNPSWFIKGALDFYYPDISKKEVYLFILSEISHLIETYSLSFLKIDLNFELQTDPYKEEFYGYYRAWYNILTELKNRYPLVFFEGCSSGGMRLDLNTISYFDANFLTDSVNPIDELRIYEGALLRFPPGYFTKWIVLRSIGNTVPKYGIPTSLNKQSIITPLSATWDFAKTTSIDFASLIAMNGIFGISGDITELSEENMNTLSYYVAFFKKWRTFIRQSVAHLFTKPLLKDDTTGWVFFQLQNPKSTQSLLFAYRLNDGETKKLICLRNLINSTNYLVVTENKSENQSVVVSGKKLMNEGILVEINKPMEAQVLSISPC